MHEFILYSQVPNDRIDTALQVLAGYTRSQPVYFGEQTIIYAQVKVPEAAVSRKVSINSPTPQLKCFVDAFLPPAWPETTTTP